MSFKLARMQHKTFFDFQFDFETEPKDVFTHMTDCREPDKKEICRVVVSSETIIWLGIPSCL